MITNDQQVLDAPITDQHYGFRPLPVAPTFLSWRGHRVAYYRDGAGDPILLVHSIHAAASAFEMRRPFLGLRDHYHVHALDLPGYGCSDRPARRYSAEDYIDVIGRVLDEIGKPTTIIASSLGAAYSVVAAARRPERVSALVLVCPTGIAQLARPAGPIARLIYRVLRGPVGQALFTALTSRAGTRYFLQQQGYARKESLTDETIAGFYDSSHMPGARFAPICFLTGMLNCDINTVFPDLRQPVLIVWGRAATTTPLRQADAFLARNSRAHLAVVEGASLLVQDECPDQFNTLTREFLTTTART